MSDFTETCDEGWNYFGNECVLFEVEQQSFTSAEEQCIKLGGHLTFIDDEEEFNLLINIWEEWTVPAKPSKWYVPELAKGIIWIA